MAVTTKKDITYRVGYSGNAIIATGGEVVCNAFHRLLYMVPGQDEYNKDMGLDITTRCRRQYTENSRDVEYETMIVEQLNKYTDIQPISVVVVYQNGMLIVVMDCIYDNNEFRLQDSSDPDTLAAMVEPKVVGGLL